MKILIINYYYSPLIDAHAYRWEQIAKHWAENGHEVEVITGPVKGTPTRACESRVSVTRVGWISRPASPPVANKDAPKPDDLMSKIAGTLRPLYRKLYWPDSAWHWVPALLINLLSKRQNKYDLVVSYYPCMGASLGVLALKAFSKHPDFRWVVDYGDPFSVSQSMQPNNYALYEKLNKFTERSLAHQATAMVFTNEPTAEAYKTGLGIADNVRIIPHLTNIDRLYAADPRPVSDTKAPTMLYYIGGFHKNIREPMRLFDLIRGLNKNESGKVLLTIFGPLNGYELQELSPIDCPEISYKGPIERDKAIEILKTADAIVNIDNKNCIMTPSKIVECISTGRPLINITNKGESYPPLQAYEQSGYVFPMTQDSITDDVVMAARQFLNKHARSSSAPLDVVRSALSCHTLETIANQYLD